MALVHHAKLTHYFSPSKLCLTDFYNSVTELYEEQAHTDLNVVADDGTVFCVHQVRTSSTYQHTYIHMQC